MASVIGFGLCSLILILLSIVHCANAYDPIAFNVYNRQPLTMGRNTPTNIVYDAVYYNHGNAYNPTSGFFTAPSSGMYVFTWSSCVAPKKIFDAEILVNGIRKGLGNCNNERGSWYENCANTVPLVLENGDKVNIRTVVANYLHGAGWSSFKGWRVY
ncbi:cerebellin-3-like [Crassostrea virginica]